MASINPISRMTPEQATSELELIIKAEAGMLVEVKENGHVALIGGFGKFVRWLYSLFTCQDGFADCRMTAIAKVIPQLFEKSQQGSTDELLPALGEKLLSLRLRRRETCSARDNLIDKLVEINRSYNPQNYIREIISEEFGVDSVVEKVVDERNPDNQWRFKVSLQESDERTFFLDINGVEKDSRPSSQQIAFWTRWSLCVANYRIDVAFQKGQPLPADLTAEAPLTGSSDFIDERMVDINKWLQNIGLQHAFIRRGEGSHYTVEGVCEGEIPVQHPSAEQTDVFLPQLTFIQLIFDICSALLSMKQYERAIYQALADVGVNNFSVKVTKKTDELSVCYVEISSTGDRGPFRRKSFTMDIAPSQETGTYPSLEDVAMRAQLTFCDEVYHSQPCIDSFSEEAQDVESGRQAFLEELSTKINQWLATLSQYHWVDQPLQIQIADDGETYTITGNDSSNELVFYHPFLEDSEDLKMEQFYPRSTAMHLIVDICTHLTTSAFCNHRGLYLPDLSAT